MRTLVALQRLDRERDTHEDRIRSMPDVLGARQKAVATALAQRERLQEELKQARMAVHTHEMDLRAKSDEVRKQELQLNIAKTNQEYQAITHHIERLRAAVGAEEDAALELYEGIERIEAKLATAVEKHAVAEREFQAYEAACGREVEESQSEIDSTDARRAQLLGALPRDLAEDYERLRKARDGLAVVPIEGRICAGCGLHLTPNDISKLLGGNIIITCKSCQRVLYAPSALAGGEAG